MLDRVEPEHVVAVALIRLLRGAEAARVVAADLGVARAAVRRANVFILDEDARGGELAAVCRVIRAGRAEDDHEAVVLRGLDAQRGIVRNDKRADVERGSRRVRHPVLVLMHGGLDGGDEELLVHLRHADALVGAVEAAGVHLRAEQQHAAIRGAVRLHALKHHLRIVQYARRRADQDIAVGYDFSVVPALALVIVHHKHVVGKLLAKDQLARGRFRLWVRISRHRKRVTHLMSPHSFSYLLPVVRVADRAIQRRPAVWIFLLFCLFKQTKMGLCLRSGFFILSFVYTN